jgi:PAS domain S-box-containing protein
MGNSETMRDDLQQLEQRWGLALQSAGFGVWDLDVRRQRVSYSPQWKAMLGYADADGVDATGVWRGRVHPDDLQPMADALNAHLTGRAAAYAHEFRLRAADGSYRWVLSRGRVVERDANGAAVRAVGTLTDLTDRREAERMRVERDRAEAASRAKSEFLARMSHELRTPLNAVLGFAQLMSQRLGQAGVEEQRQQLAEVERAGWHLLQMVDDVLDQARIEGGTFDIRVEPVALVALVREAIETLDPPAREHAVQVTVVAAEPPELTLPAAGA